MDEFTRSSQQEFQIYRGEGQDIVDSNVKLSSLWGSSRVRLLKNLDVSRIALGSVSSEYDGEKIAKYWQNLFSDLLCVYNEISSPDPVNEDRVENLQVNCKNMIAKMRCLIGHDRLTPYMHVIEAHVATMIRSEKRKNI